jgi:hypothetical protein
MAASRAELNPHPTQARGAVRRLAAAAAMTRESLQLEYRAEADIARLVLPSPAAARRRDGLWQHSCFEAFLQPDGSDLYYEFNFSPSGEWAAYRFAGRREGRSLPDLPAPAIGFAARADGCRLSADIPLAALPELARAPALAVGLTAVLEQADGVVTHWALAHGGESPDFHDASTFTLRLAPA